MQCSVKQPFESECICVTDIKSSWPLLYLYSPYSCTVTSQRLTPTEFTLRATLCDFSSVVQWNIWAQHVHVPCVYTPFLVEGHWQGVIGSDHTLTTLWKKTQMMTNEHGTEIVSSCPSKTDLPNICTSLVHKLACIYIENPGRFNLLFKVDQLLSIISRDCYCVTYLSF